MVDLSAVSPQMRQHGRYRRYWGPKAVLGGCCSACRFDRQMDREGIAGLILIRKGHRLEDFLLFGARRS